MQNLITNARAMATAIAANVNIDAVEENNIKVWEDQCYESSLNAIAAFEAGDMAEGRIHADWMRHCRKMADAGIARRIGR
jgi:hypothetical protein